MRPESRSSASAPRAESLPKTDAMSRPPPVHCWEPSCRGQAEALVVVLALEDQERAQRRQRRRRAAVGVGVVAVLRPGEARTIPERQQVRRVRRTDGRSCLRWRSRDLERASHPDRLSGHGLERAPVEAARRERGRGRSRSEGVDEGLELVVQRRRPQGLTASQRGGVRQRRRDVVRRHDGEPNAGVAQLPERSADGVAAEAVEAAPRRRGPRSPRAGGRARRRRSACARGGGRPRR